MKVAKGDIYSQANSIPVLKFEDQQLTSFAGLVVFQKLFRNCRLKERMEESCAHLLGRHYYSFSTIVQCVIVHLIHGFRWQCAEHQTSRSAIISIRRLSATLATNFVSLPHIVSPSVLSARFSCILERKSRLSK